MTQPSTDSIEYTIYSHSEITGKDYVEIQLGRQKRKNFKKNSIFLKQEVFEILEGTIWQKFREYRPGSISKIEKYEWLRISKEFLNVVEEIKTSGTEKELMDILNYRGSDELPAYSSLDSLKESIKDLLTDFAAWINENAQNEDYITICNK